MNIDLQAVEEAAKTLYIRALKMLPPDIKAGFERLQRQRDRAHRAAVLAPWCTTSRWPSRPTTCCARTPASRSTT
jgi:hypothetical protein